MKKVIGLKSLLGCMIISIICFSIAGSIDENVYLNIAGCVFISPVLFVAILYTVYAWIINPIKNWRKKI